MTENKDLGEFLIGFRPEVVKLADVTVVGETVCNEVLGFPDRDLTITCVPRTYREIDDGVGPWFREHGGVKELELNQKQRERMVGCIDRLKLPPIVAVHLTFNEPERDLSEFEGESGNVEGEIPMLVGLYGEAGVGKTTIAKKMVEDGIIVVDFDPFSSGAADKNLKAALNRLTGVFLGGNRPELVLIDMPGVVDDKDRYLDIYDMVAMYSIQCIFLDRERSRPFGEALGSYMADWEDSLAKARVNVREGDAIFRQAIGW